MDDKKVIAFVGMPGSGKGTCTDFLNQKYDWPIVHFGNMVYEEVKKRGLDNIKHEVEVREDMRRQEGPAVMAVHAVNKANEYFQKGSKVTLLDGLYSWSEYKYLDGIYSKNMTVIAIAAPKNIRRQRVLDRKDSHRRYTLDQLIDREIAEIENLEKGGPIAYADYTIINDGTAENLKVKLDQILKQIGL